MREGGNKKKKGSNSVPFSTISEIPSRHDKQENPDEVVEKRVLQLSWTLTR